MPSPRRHNLVGMKFGRLTVESFAEIRGGEAYWTCGCDCGHTCVVRASRLKSGKTRSCGCLCSISGHNERRPLAERFWANVQKNGPLPSTEAVAVHPEIEGQQCWIRQERCEAREGVAWRWWPQAGPRRRVVVANGSVAETPMPAQVRPSWVRQVLPSVRGNCSGERRRHDREGS